MTEIAQEISCSNCVGACCQDVRLPLFQEEAVRLAVAGTDIKYAPFPHGDDEYTFLAPDVSRKQNWAACVPELEALSREVKTEPRKRISQDVVEQARTLLPGQGLFIMLGRCAFLQPDNSCGDYLNRPLICREFEVGRNKCLAFRERAGVSVQIRTQEPVPALSYSDDLL